MRREQTQEEEEEEEGVTEVVIFREVWKSLTERFAVTIKVKKVENTQSDVYTGPLISLSLSSFTKQHITKATQAEELFHLRC